MITDAHTHLGLFSDIDHKPDELITSMDEAGIDYSIVLANFSKSIGSISTEDAISICQQYPRLKPVGNVDWSNFTPSQIDLLIQHLDSGKIHSVKLYAGYENYFWSDEKLEPLYKFCEKACQDTSLSNKQCQKKNLNTSKVMLLKLRMK